MCSEEGGYSLNIKSLLNDVSATLDVLRKGCSALHEAKKCSDLPLVMLKIIHAPFFGDDIVTLHTSGLNRSCLVLSLALV